MAWLQTVGESILRRLYQRCEEIYAPSESMAAVLHDQRMSRHIAIWSRGIDRQLFHPGRRDPEWRMSLGIADDEAVVLFVRSEEHTSELQSLMRISYAVFRLKKKRQRQLTTGKSTFRHPTPQT